MNEKLYVDVEEIIQDWDVSRAKAYEMIKAMNEDFKKINPNHIIIKGRVNRRFYEENCYKQLNH